MLRKTLMSGLALAILWTLPIGAQMPDENLNTLPELSLDEVLQNYYRAIGGEDAWHAVQSLKLTGTMLMGPGMEAPFTVYSMRPDKERLEFTFQGMTGVQAIDGEQAWMFMPFMGKTEPELMPEEMAKQMKDQLDIEGALIDWVGKGHTLEMLGLSQAQGTDAYKIKATLKSGTEQIYYLDAEEFVPFLMEDTRTIQGNKVETETIFSNFKEVDGLIMAHSIENRMKGQPGGQTITVKTVEIDPDLSAVEFAMPAVKAAAE
jgi:hypothetical protein